jgi:rubredoxin
MRDNQMSENLYLDEVYGDDDGPVEPGMECPVCGEARMGWLANDDGIVTCQSCGSVYDPEPACW